MWCLLFVVWCLLVVVSLSLFMLVVYFRVASIGVPCSEFGARCVVCVVHAYCVVRVVNWLVVFRAWCFCRLVFGVWCLVFVVRCWLLVVCCVRLLVHVGCVLFVDRCLLFVA